MTILSRRSFLQGVMAVAGVAVAGIPPEVLAAPPDPPAAITLPKFEFGDIWVMHRGAHEFLGCASSIAVKRFPDHSLVGDIQHPFYLREMGVDAAIWVDDAGAGLIYDIAATSGLREFIVGAYPSAAVKFSGFFTGYNSVLLSASEARRKSYRFEIAINVSGRPETVVA
jgi:hypothetical protein